MKQQSIFWLLIIIVCSCTSEEKKEESNFKLWYKQPAFVWEEALPVGNGRLAAMVSGNIHKEIITLNEETLWSQFPEDNNNPEAKKYLPKIREAIFNGDHLEADKLCLQIQGAKCAPYAPLANLVFDFETGDSIFSYYRDLDLQNAISNVQYTTENGNFSRETFISNPDQVMLMRLNSSQEKQLNFRVSLSSLLRHSVTIENGNTVVLKGKCPKYANPLRFPNNPIQYDKQDGEGMNFDARIKLILSDGNIAVKDSFLVVENSSSADIYFSAGTSFNGFDKSPGFDGIDPETISIPYLDKALKKGYEEIKKDHIKDFSSFFNRVDLHLNEQTDETLPTNELLLKYNQGKNGNELEELLFHFGRYLFISSSREGGIPIHLQGKWSNKVLPPWNDNYTTNINLQMSYWMGNSTNLNELNEPLINQIRNMSINGEKTASTNYNLKGWCAHHNSDIWAMTSPGGEFGKFGLQSIKWMTFPLAGAWLCQHLYDQYLFTQDLQYLKKDAYPMMKGAAVFLLDWLVESPEGYLVTCPSTSPENAFYDIEGNNVASDMASTIDIAIVKELFKNCIDAADILDVDVEFSGNLKRALQKLPEYKIGKHGQLQEWFHDWEEVEVDHRHLSHLYGLHPGSEISPITTPELADACKETLKRRGDEATGWSLAWKINMWARLLDGNKAHRLIQNLLKFSIPNYGDEVNNKNAHGQFQKLISPTNNNVNDGGGGTYPNLMGCCPPLILDSNFGYVSGVTEMLLQSHMDELHILPALPDVWSSGKVSGLCAKGGFVVDIEWENGMLKECTILSKKDTVCKIRYGNSSKEFEVKINKTTSIKASDFNIK